MRIARYVTILLLLATAASAADPVWSVSVGTNPDPSDREWRVALGYSWDEPWGVELAWYNGPESSDAGGNQYYWWEERDDPMTLAILGVGRLRVSERFRLFGVIGPSFTRTKRTWRRYEWATNERLGVTKSTDTEPTSIFGVGFEADMYRGVGVRAAWESVDDEDMFTLGLSCRF